MIKLEFLFIILRQYCNLYGKQVVADAKNLKRWPIDSSISQNGSNLTLPYYCFARNHSLCFRLLCTYQVWQVSNKSQNSDRKDRPNVSWKLSRSTYSVKISLTEELVVLWGEGFCDARCQLKNANFSSIKNGDWFLKCKVMPIYVSAHLFCWLSRSITTWKSFPSFSSLERFTSGGETPHILEIPHKVSRFYDSNLQKTINWLLFCCKHFPVFMQNVQESPFWCLQRHTKNRLWFNTFALPTKCKYHNLLLGDIQQNDYRRRVPIDDWTHSTAP